MVEDACTALEFQGFPMASEAPSVLCDSSGKIQSASRAWLVMVGLSSLEEARDRDALRILHGPGTNLEAVEEMRDAIALGTDSWSGTLVHYAVKDAHPFIHTLHVQPVPDAFGDASFTLFRATSTNVRHIGMGVRSANDASGCLSACEPRSCGRKKPGWMAVDHAASAAAELVGEVDVGRGVAMHGPPLKMCKTVGVSASEMKVFCCAVAPYPIVWASEGWLEQCAFTAPEVIGTTLKVIQGPGTDRAIIAQLMDCVRSRQDVDRLRLVNYDKDKNPFAHSLSVRLVQRVGCAVFDATSTEVHALASRKRAWGESPSTDAETWGETIEEYLQGWSSLSHSIKSPCLSSTSVHSV